VAISKPIPQPEVCDDAIYPSQYRVGEYLDQIDDQTLAQITKALGNPTRIKILRLLLEHGNCITGELVAQLPLAQSTISEHLRILREAHLIQGEIEGPRTSYCVNRRMLAAFKHAVTQL
jgi:ArsR family transcriptional regulator